MSFWDRHKNLMVVISLFLLLLFLEWLFYLRGCSNEVETLNRTFEKKLTKDIEELANSNKVSRVSDLLANYRKANEELASHIKELENRFAFSFPDPLIPDKFIPQSYVRQRLREERDYFDQQLATSQGIELSTLARTLGMSLPDDVTEDIETDMEWMRQILVLRRVCDLLLQLKSEDAQVPAVLAIDLVRPLSSEDCGVPSTYVKEYPVEIELYISLEGLSQLLQKSSQPQTMQIIRELEIDSDPLSRRSRHFKTESRITRKGKEWYSHFYRVRLICATAVSLSQKQRKDVKKSSSNKPSSKRPAVPISH